MHLVDDHHRGVGVGLDQVAGMHQQVAGAAVDRRANLAVLEIQARRLHRGRVSLHRGRQRGGRRLGLIVLLARPDILLEQNRVALLVGRGLAILRAIPGEVGLRLLQRGVERARIDREQQVALLDVLSLPEMHLHDLAADLRLHLDGRESLDAADRADRVGDSLLLDLGREDRHRVTLAESVSRTVRTSHYRNQCDRRPESCRPPSFQREIAFQLSNWITAPPVQGYGPPK